MLTGALISGKICTTVLFLSLIAMVVFPNLTMDQVTIITIVDIVFMLIAFAEYLMVYIRRNSHIRNIED